MDKSNKRRHWLNFDQAMPKSGVAYTLLPRWVLGNKTETNSENATNKKMQRYIQIFQGHAVGRMTMTTAGNTYNSAINEAIVVATEISRKHNMWVPRFEWAWMGQKDLQVQNIYYLEPHVTNLLKTWHTHAHWCPSSHRSTRLRCDHP